MKINALRSNISPQEFWGLTPKEIVEVIEANLWGKEQEYKLAGWLAWHIAALERQKKLPKLERIIGSNQKQKKPMTLDKQLSNWRTLAKDK